MIGSPTLGFYEIGWDEEDVELSELPVQYVYPPVGVPLPTPGTVWVPGEPAYLKRVSKHAEGSSAATVALVTVDGKAPFEVLHPDAATVRKEVALDFGDASVPSARTWARRFLDIAALARSGITIELIPDVGPRPYRDFVIGDTIAVLGEAHRVVAIGMELDAVRSVIKWTVDLDQPKTMLEERLASIMRRQLPGAAGGRTLLPSPLDMPSVDQTEGSESTETWSAPATGTVVLRKNGTPITGASIATAGKVTLTDAARRYVKESDLIDFTVDGVAGFPAGWKPPSGRWLQEFAVANTGGAGTGVTITVRYV